MPDNEQVPDVQDDEEFPLNFKPPLISRFLKQRDEDAVRREEEQRLIE